LRDFFDLDDMRNNWKSAIEDQLDCKVDGSVNLHNEYASIMKEPEKAKHILRYVYRYPVEDLFNVQIRKQSINYLETGHFENLQFEVFGMLHVRKSGLIWCGLLSSGRRKRLTRLLDMPQRFWQNLKYFEKEIERRSKLCRDCGMQLEENPFEKCEYDGDNEPKVFKPPNG